MKNNAKLIIEKLDANILVVGKTGSGKSTFIKGLNIPDSYYFDFPSIKESKSWDYPVSLTDRNFKDFDFENLKEKKPSSLMLLNFLMMLITHRLLTLLEMQQVKERELLLSHFQKMPRKYILSLMLL